MAGAILVRPGLAYSCGSMAFDAVLVALGGDLDSDIDLVMARDLGVLSVLDVDAGRASWVLDQIEGAAMKVSGATYSVKGWGYDAKYWTRVQNLMPEVVTFVHKARMVLASERHENNRS